MKIFVDTAPFIYLIEEHPEYVDRIKQYFIDRFKAGDEFVTSVVSIAEFGVVPNRDNKLELVIRLKDFLAATGIGVMQISLEHAEQAAKLRGQYKFLKGMDAFQVAVALDEKCQQFLTNDRALNKIEQIEVVLVENL